MQQYTYHKLTLTFLLTSLLTILMVATGCSGAGTSNAQPTPSPTPATGQLGLSPTNMNFGTLTVGNSASQAGSLTATGTSITVSSASWNGAGYSLSGITFPVTLPAGQSIPFTVTFDPQTAGTSTGAVLFISNASNSPASESLTGSGVSPHRVALSWSPSPSTVIGYNVYRGTQTGGPYTRLNASVQAGTTYSDTTVLPGTTYFYVVTAVDSSSQESPFSNETMAVISP